MALADGFGKGTPHHGLLADQRVREFVEALASREPAPGGGSAAALTSALGAALLGMVGRIVLAPATSASGVRRL